MFLERLRLRASECAPADAAVAVYTKGTPNSGPVVVLLDALKAGLLAEVVHECVHFVLFDDYAKFDKDLAEAQIEAVEDLLEKYINESPRRIRWWRKQIATWIEVRTRRR